jgi:hypothetical protein
MTFEFDVEARLRQHMERVRAEVAPGRTLESNILKALDASIGNQPHPGLWRHLALTFALVVLAIVLVIGLPLLRNLSQPGGNGGIVKPLVVPCHYPSWVPEPVKSVVTVATRCRAEAPVKQLDLLRLQESGVGATTTRPFRLLDGRYTVFIFEDPPQCVRGFQLVDRQNRGLQATWQYEPRLAGALRVPMVQEVVPREDYRIGIRTDGANCAWMAQVVLNSMLYDANPHFATGGPAPPPPPTITVKKGGDTSFRVTAIGFYGANWTMTPDGCSYSVDLKSPDGRQVHMGDGSPGRTMVNNLPAFIGVEPWSVIVTGDCDWTVNIYPYTGDLGGGTRGFSP